MRQEIVLGPKGSRYKIEVMTLPSWNQKVWFQMGESADDIVLFNVGDTDQLKKDLHMVEALAISKELSAFESNIRYLNGVEDSFRVRKQRDLAISNREKLRGLLRAEGKSPTKDRKNNTNLDRLSEIQNNAQTVCNAMSDDTHPQSNVHQYKERDL